MLSEFSTQDAVFERLYLRNPDTPFSCKQEAESQRKRFLCIQPLSAFIQLDFLLATEPKRLDVWSEWVFIVLLTCMIFKSFKIMNYFCPFSLCFSLVKTGTAQSLVGIFPRPLSGPRQPFFLTTSGLVLSRLMQPITPTYGLIGRIK